MLPDDTPDWDAPSVSIDYVDRDRAQTSVGYYSGGLVQVTGNAPCSERNPGPSFSARSTRVGTHWGRLPVSGLLP